MKPLLMMLLCWLVVAVSGCSYLTPPITNVSGPSITLETKEVASPVSSRRKRKIRIRIKRYGEELATWLARSKEHE